MESHEPQSSGVTGQDVSAATGDPPPPPPEYARETADVVAALGSDATAGLTGTEAAKRLSRYGANEIRGETPPSVWAVALAAAARPDEHHARRASRSSAS